MLRCRLLLVVLVGISATVEAKEASFAWYASVSSYTYSEPTSIESMLHDFRGDIRSGERAFTLNRAETGIRHGNWSLGYGYRYDYFLRFSEATARAYHSSAHDQKIPAGQSQPIYLKASHIKANGPTIGYRWQLTNKLSTRFKVSLLDASDMVEGVAEGSAELTDSGDYSGAIDFLVSSSEDVLLEKPVPEPKGKGWALDLGLSWIISENWLLDIQIVDAYSKIKWQDVLFSDLQADTATVSFDDTGRLSTKPVLSGYQYLYDTTQKLPLKYKLNLHYQLADSHLLYIQPFYVPDYSFQWEAGYEYSIRSATAVGFYMNPRARSVGAIARLNYVSLRLGLDNMNVSQAHTWDFNLGIEIPFR